MQSGTSKLNYYQRLMDLGQQREHTKLQSARVLITINKDN